MNDTLAINPDITFYIIPKIGFLVSNFKADILIDNPIAASVLTVIKSGGQAADSVIDLLSDQYAPTQLMKILQSLIANKYVTFSTNTNNNNLPTHILSKLEYKIKCLFNPLRQADIILSTSFFDQLILRKNTNNNIFATLSEESILIGPDPLCENAVCSKCFKTRLLAQRPLLKFASKHIDNIEFVPGKINLESILNKFNSISVKKEGALSPHLFWVINLNSSELDSYDIPSIGECDQCRKNHSSSLNMLNDISSIPNKRTTGFRVLSLDETYSKLLPLVHPYVGIISKLTCYKGLDSDLVCNYSSGRNLAFSSSNKFWLNNHLRSASGGKGKTKRQAQVSALCEAVERYSMVHQGQRPDKIAAYQANLDHVIHPHTSLNFSAAQYAQRQSTNSATDAFHQLIPKPFNAQESVHWSKAYSLTHDRSCHILSEIAYAQYKGKTEDALYAYPDSNGCASGNTYLEAILQGSLELIERDAVAIWWYNMCDRPHINIHSIGNDYISAVSDYYRKIGRAIHILDITTDIAIPCFVSVTYSLKTGNEILYGFGCHLDAGLAIERSITELNQLLPLSQTRRSKSCDQTLYHWMDSEYINKHSYIDAHAEIDFKSHYPDLTTHCLETAIETVIQNLSEQDIELIAFDLTQNDTGMPVVKMIAPGLRHFWRRTAPGRLYTVPVKLGWRDSALDESELNPHSITI